MNAWRYQYEKPALKTLLNGLEPSVCLLLEELRRSLAEKLDKKPRIEWMGITWHWCESTTPENAGMLSAVYLIPDPDNPRIAITVARAFFDNNPPYKLPKQLHSGLTAATCVGHQTWCEWSITNQESCDAIIQIIDQAIGLPTPKNP